ncbi:MAG: S9 family peptidase [Sphingomonadales bacterium]|nr:MAG: S9 family peptidase [Sphingomonadales bacterium]
MAMLALAAAPAALAQTAVQTRAPLATEVFAELPQIESPSLSPNGKRIAAKLARDGQMFLAIIPVDERVAPTFIHPGKVDLNWWRWVNDDWIVIGVGREQNVEGTNFYVSRAIGIQTSTGKMVPVADKDAAQRGDDIVWVARDGSARVMLSYQTSIYVDNPGFWSKVEEVDLSTGKRRLVQGPREGVLDWYADRDGVIRMGIGSSLDGRSSRLLYRESADAPVRTIDRAKRGKDRLTVPSLFLRDKNKALVIEDDEQGFSALYEYDLATLQRGKQLFSTPGYDIGGVVPDTNGDGFAGVQIEENRPMIRWLDPEMTKLHSAIAEQIKGGQVEIASLSRDGEKAIININGADTPGAWMLFDKATGALDALAYDNLTIRLKRMHPVKTIRYKARDGLEIAAVLTLPRGKTDKLPLIVMPHGGPSVRDSEVWDWWAQFLADRGYAVIQPNYRGSTGYGTKFLEKGEGQWGLAMQDDLDDAVKALADLGIADSKRVCMVGASYGGYAALRAAQRDGDKYRCAVSYAGVSDLNRMLRHHSNFLFAGARGDWLRAQAPELKDVSPVNFPAAFSIPVLLMHGEEDRVVPIVQSRVMAQKLKSAGKDVTYIVQPLADHHFTRQEDRVEFLKALEAFLAKHNPA